MPVVDDVANDSTNGSGHFDVTRAGTLVYRRARSGAPAMRTLQWVDPAGRREPLLAKPGAYQNPRLSPAGTRVALTVVEGNSQDLWVYDLQRDAMTRLTFGGGNDNFPTWSPDGHYIVFTTTGGGLFQVRADGANQPQDLTHTNITQNPWSFTPDGKRLAYYDRSDRQIWTVPLDDQGGQLKAGTPEPFLKSRFDDRAPSFSPDGRWLAYQSNESGRDEVYVRPYPPASSGGGTWQISNSGATVPRWSRNGHELLYQSGDQIMAASYTVKGDTFVAEKPRVWIATLGGAEWDVAPDDTRVAVVTPVESADAATQEHEVVFLENFVDELRRRAPLGK